MTWAEFMKLFFLTLYTWVAAISFTIVLLILLGAAVGLALDGLVEVMR